MPLRRKLMYGAALGTLVAGVPAQADVVTYSYDALGRLVASSTAGGPNNGISTATCFDGAGNRVLYTSGQGANAACTGVTPPLIPGDAPEDPQPCHAAKQNDGDIARGVADRAATPPPCSG